MKKIVIALAAACLSLHLSAQQYVESVFLKNGSIIKGTVIEQVPDGDIKIQRNDGSVYVYPMSEVIKITKEQVTAPAPAVSKPTTSSFSTVQEPKTTTTQVSEWWEPNGEYKRAEKSRFGLQVGWGIAPSNIGNTLRKDLMAETGMSRRELAQAGMFVDGKAGYSFQLNPLWTMYFNEGSQWFFDAGLLAEFNRGAASIEYDTVETKNKLSHWFLGPQANIGMCILKNTTGDPIYFYWKAGLSFGWAMGGKGVVEGYMDGELVSYDEVDNSGASTKFIVRPNIEVGVTLWNTYTRFGVRYSPTIINNLQYHPVSAVLQVSFWGKKARAKYKTITVTH